jgi:Fe-S cluster assembly ATP-binding protein
MLELRNIGFSVPAKDSESDSPNQKTIVDDVSFTFEQGGFYAITGPNGSGKSTIAKLIMGINPSTRGQIIYDG